MTLKPSAALSSNQSCIRSAISTGVPRIMWCTMSSRSGRPFAGAIGSSTCSRYCPARPNSSISPTTPPRRRTSQPRTPKSRGTEGTHRGTGETKRAATSGHGYDPSGAGRAAVDAGDDIPEFRLTAVAVERFFLMITAAIPVGPREFRGSIQFLTGTRVATARDDNSLISFFLIAVE
jgi:hypothetical protein